MMGVYIKGMDMPKDGCHHTICIYADGTVSTGGRVYMAIPVPAHGRLIDANKLKADNPIHMGADVPYVTEVTVEEIIDDAPTIISASEEDK